jgi:hypothetical protein
MRVKKPKAPGRFQRVYVVEFLHSLGWAAVEGGISFRWAQERRRYWSSRSPSFRYRVTRYKPAKGAA